MNPLTLPDKGRERGRRTGYTRAHWEAAAVALGLRLCRPWPWGRLDPAVQDRVEAWLRGALRALPVPGDWYLFPFCVAGFLEPVGRGDAETRRARGRALDLLEEWYRGQGWYSDGDVRALPTTTAGPLRLYPVPDAHLSGRDGVHAGRLREHLEGFGLMFGGDGAPVHLGRSMTHRFTAGTAVAPGAVTGHTPLAPGVSRRLLSGCLRYFLDRGAVGANGLLSPGWHGPHTPTVQPHSGPASPHWASQSFLCLLAPSDHPLWTAREEAAPSEDPDRVPVLPTPGFLVQATGADGVVRVHRVVGAPHGLGAELTGWAVGPDEPPFSSLESLHGWSGQDGVRAPVGTASTPRTCVPRHSSAVVGFALRAGGPRLAPTPHPRHIRN